MTDNQESTSTNQEDDARGRRQLIKALGASAGGIVVASQWSKPIVESVVVPLHAQASPTALNAFLGCDPAPTAGTEIGLGAVLTVDATITVQGAGSIPVGETIIARWTCGPTGNETILDTQTLTTTSAATQVSPAVEQSTFTVDSRCQPGDRVQVGLSWAPSSQALLVLDPGVTTPLTTQDSGAPGGEPCFWPLAPAPAADAFLGCSPAPTAGTEIGLGALLTVDATITLLGEGSIPVGETIIARWTCGPIGNETVLDTQTLTTTSAATQVSPAVEQSTFTVDSRCQPGDRVQVGLSWDPSPQALQVLDPEVTTPLTTQDSGAPGGEPCFWPLAPAPAADAFLGCSPAPTAGTEIAIGALLTVDATITLLGEGSIPVGETIIARWTCGPIGNETVLDTQTLTTTSAATQVSPAIEQSTFTVDSRCQPGDRVQVGLSWDPSPQALQVLDPGVTTPLTTQDSGAPGGEPCFWPLAGPPELMLTCVGVSPHLNNTPVYLANQAISNRTAEPVTVVVSVTDGTGNGVSNQPITISQECNGVPTALLPEPPPGGIASIGTNPMPLNPVTGPDGTVAITFRPSCPCGQQILLVVQAPGVPENRDCTWPKVCTNRPGGV